MGDAGMILFGPAGREILSAGTIIFAVFGTGSQILAGQLALSVLSNENLCTVAFAGIFAVAVTLASFPRTLDSLGFLSIVGGASIVVAGIVALAGAGAAPISLGDIEIAVASDFTSAFSESINSIVIILSASLGCSRRCSDGFLGLLQGLHHSSDANNISTRGRNANYLLKSA